MASSQPASLVGMAGSHANWNGGGGGCESHLMVCQDMHSSTSFFYKCF